MEHVQFVEFETERGRPMVVELSQICLEVEPTFGGMSVRCNGAWYSVTDETAQWLRAIMADLSCTGRILRRTGN